MRIDLTPTPPAADADPVDDAAPAITPERRVREEPRPIAGDGARTAAPGDPLADPEVPFSPDVPASITEPRKKAEHLVRVLHAQVGLRDKLFYDMGHALVELMKLKHLYGAADVKELCTKASLPVSHMTAQKYMAVARIFDRATALRIRVEKCYLLTLYAQATDRRPEDARGIVARNELLVGVEVRATRATIAQLREAIAAAEEERAEPPVRVSADDRRAVADLETMLRDLGFAGSRASIDEDRHVDVRFKLDKIRDLQATVPVAVAKWVKKLRRDDPARFAPFLKLGLKPPEPR